MAVLSFLCDFCAWCLSRGRRWVSMLLIAVLIGQVGAPTAHAVFGLGDKNDHIAPTIEIEHLVSVLVEEDLLTNSRLGPKIERFASDLQKNLLARSIVIPVPRDASPRDIYEGNAALYFSGEDNDGQSQLIGTVLVGDVPLPIVSKSKNLFPTVFPYTDFLEPSYEWDPEQERFVYVRESEAEIWHSLIRLPGESSDFERLSSSMQEDDLERREDELIAWFDRNHRFHTQDTDAREKHYPHKILYVDILRQKYGLDTEALERYNQWLEHVEDLVYLRFNKPWAADMITYFAELAEQEQGGGNVFEAFSNPERDMMYLQDVETEAIVRGFIKRYFDEYGGYLSRLHSRVETAGRWKAEDTDTTLSLVSRKDEASALYIRNVNDVLEDVLIEAARDADIAKDILIECRTYAGEFPPSVPPPAPPSPLNPANVKDLYWNGVQRSEMTVEDCTLMRGNLPDEDHPYAQMVEANRAFNSDTEGDCGDYEDCCYDKTEMDYEIGKRYFDPDRCDPEGDQGSPQCACHTGSVWTNPMTMVGATQPVFDIKGSQAVDEGAIGASGCAPIMQEGNLTMATRIQYPTAMLFPSTECRIDSLMVHDEPTLLTIQSQILHTQTHLNSESGETRSMPVDDPRGFSFYNQKADGEEEFYQIAFPNLFELREVVRAHPERTEAEHIAAVKAEMDALLWNIIEEVNAANENNFGVQALSSALVHEGVESIIGTGLDLIKSNIPPTAFEVPGSEELVDEILGLAETAIVDLVTPLIDSFLEGLWDSDTPPDVDPPTPTEPADPEEPTPAEEASGFVANLLGEQIGDMVNGMISEVTSKVGGGAETISPLIFESALSRLDKDRIAYAIVWLEKPIHEKNNLALKKALSDPAVGQEFFMDPDFNGYEMVYFITDDTEDGSRDPEIVTTFENEDLGFSETYEAARSAERIFEIEQEAGPEIRFMGRDLKSDFLGKDAIEAECSDGNFLENAACTAEHALNPDAKSYISRDGVLTTGFGTASLPPSQMSVTPESLLRESFGVQSFQVRVVLQDEHGDRLADDYTSQVQLRAAGKNLDRYFNVQPDVVQTVQHGEALFWLQARSQPEGASFDLEVLATNAEHGVTLTQTIPVTLPSYAIRGGMERLTFLANDTDPAEITLRIIDQNRDVYRSLQGIDLLLSSDGDDVLFPDGKRVPIKDGEAQTTFLPGKVAGDYEITVTESQNRLASYTIPYTVKPREAQQLLFGERPEVLLSGQNYQPITVQLSDIYGNAVEGDQTIRWEAENLQLQEGHGQNLIQKHISSASHTIHIRPDGSGKPPRLSVASSVLGADKGRSVTFTLVDDVVLTLLEDPSSWELYAGDTDDHTLTLEARTSDGKLLPGEYSLSIVSEFGVFPDTVELRDGRAQVLFQTGVRAGETAVQIGGGGFRTLEVPLQIYPTTIAKLELDADYPHLDMSNYDGGEMEIHIRAIDRFGNTVPSYNDPVKLFVNEEDRSKKNILDFLKLLGVVNGETSNATRTRLEELEGENYAIESQTDMVTFDSSWTFRLENGEEHIKITPQNKSGLVRLVVRPQLAEQNNTLAPSYIVPGTEEIEIVESLTFEDIDALNPKSLLTIMMGHAGGDLLHHDSLAQRWLLSGDSQSVVTQIADPIPPKVYGYLDPTGWHDKRLTAKFLPGETFRLEISDTEKGILLTQAELLFPHEEKVKWGHHVHIDFLGDLSLRQNNQDIELGTEPILTLTERGGLQLLRPDIHLEMTDQSLTMGTLFLGNEMIARITYVPQTTNIQAVEHFIDRTDDGWFVLPVNEDVMTTEYFVGQSTNDTRGLALVSRSENESPLKSLGRASNSIEDAHSAETIAWDGGWKLIPHFAAGARIGESARFGASDMLTVWGDPSLVVGKPNGVSELGITEDIGQVLWRTRNGTIEDILVGDLNADERAEIMPLEGDTLYGLYQDEDEIGVFADRGAILRFADGAEDVVAVDIGRDQLTDIIQLNINHELILHRNLGNRFVPEPLDLPTDRPVREIAVGRFNNDAYDDLLLIDTWNTLFTAAGTEEGFLIPEEWHQFPPYFEPLEETYTVAANESPEERHFQLSQSPNLDHTYIQFPNSLYQVDELQYRYFPGNDPVYIPLTVNRRIAAELTVEIPEMDDPSTTRKVFPGDRFDFELKLTSDQSLDDVEVLIPEFNHLKILPETLEFIHAGRHAKFSEFNASDIALSLQDISLSGTVEATIHWQAEITDIAPIRYTIEDYAHQDNIDDVLIAWKDGDTEQLIMLQSSGDETQTPINEGEPLHSGAVKEKQGTLDKVFDWFFDDVDAAGISQGDNRAVYTAETVSAPQIDIPGIPEDWQHTIEYPSTETDLDGASMINKELDAINTLVQKEIDLQKPSMKCGDGRCGNFVFSIAPLLPPGYPTLYIPPYWMPSGISWGLPIVYFPVPRLLSVFRLYQVFTTTGKTATVMCLGLQPPFMALGAWFPNCKILKFTDVGKSGDYCGMGEGDFFNFLKNQSDNLFDESSGEDSTMGSFEISYKEGFSNVQIAGVDIVQNWVQAQYRELSNFKYPRINIIPPSLPSTEGLTDLKNQDGREMLTTLKESSFFDIQEYEVSIPYPELPDKEQLAKFREQIDEWTHIVDGLEEEVKGWADGMKQQIQDRKNAINREIQRVQSYPEQVGSQVKQTGENLKAVPGQIESSVKNEILSTLQSNLQELDKVEQQIQQYKSDLQNYAEEWKQLPDKLDQNYEILTQQYPNEIKKLKDIPNTIKQRIKELEKYRTILQDYFGNWLEDLKRSLKAWEVYREIFNGVLLAWDGFIKIFFDFTVKCSTCSTHRGTIVEFLFRILLGGIQLPVVSLPRLPDITMDFSRIAFGFEIQIPRPTFEPVQLGLFDLPSPPNLSLPALNLPQVPTLPDVPNFAPDINVNLDLNLQLNINLPPLPELPPVPEIPTLPELQLPEIPELPALQLPQLPTIPAPPVPPGLDVLASLQAIVSFPMSLLGLFCQILKAAGFIPEWFVRGNIELVTNRLNLVFKDFIKLPFNTPKLPDLASDDDIQFVMELNLDMTFDQLVKIVEQIADQMRCIINSVRLDTEGSGGGGNCSASVELSSQLIAEGKQTPQRLIAQTPISMTTEEFLADTDPVSVQSFEQSPIIRQLAQARQDEALQALGQWVASSQTPSQIPSYAYDTWLTSQVFDPSDIPQMLEDESKAEIVTQEYLPHEKQNIYYYDPETDRSEKYTYFDLGRNFVGHAVDLDGDGERELIYSTDRDLYLKYRVRQEGERFTDKDKIRADRGRFDHIGRMTYAEFQALRHPVRSISAITDVDEVSLHFEPMYDTDRYYEWTFSERSEILQEAYTAPEERFSKLWYTVGLYLDERPAPEKIAPSGIQILSTKGDPVLRDKASRVLPRFRQYQCTDPDTIKPYYYSSAYLTAVQNGARIWWTPIDEAEPAQEVFLAAGEIWHVPEGEVCVLNGEIRELGSGEYGERTLTNHLALNSGAELVLDENDIVYLQMANGLKRELYGPMTYRIETIDPKNILSDTIRLDVALPLGNYYGMLQAFNAEDESFRLPTHLHDPQLADDVWAPDIRIAGGRDIWAPLYKPLTIDARDSTDNDQIIDAWWDTNINVDGNNDNDPTNDRDYPHKDQSALLSLPQKLTFTIPARSVKENLKLNLWLEDRAGNRAHKTLTVHYRAPNISLKEASRISQTISGSLQPIVQGVPVTLWRKRDGADWQKVLSPLTTNAEGKYRVSDLSLGGGIVLKNAVGTTIAEILPSGRPVLMDENLSLQVQGATTSRPFGVSIVDTKNGELAHMSFERSESRIELRKDDFDFGEGSAHLQLLDEKVQDSWKLVPFADDAPYPGMVALVNTDTHESGGLWDTKGNFYNGANFMLKLRSAGQETDPVIFEVWDRRGEELLVSFFIRKDPELTLH